MPRKIAFVINDSPFNSEDTGKNLREKLEKYDEVYYLLVSPKFSTLR